MEKQGGTASSNSRFQNSSVQTKNCVNRAYAHLRWSVHNVRTSHHHGVSHCRVPCPCCISKFHMFLVLAFIQGYRKSYSRGVMFLHKLLLRVGYPFPDEGWARPCTFPRRTATRSAWQSYTQWLVSQEDTCIRKVRPCSFCAPKITVISYTPVEDSRYYHKRI